MKTIFKTTKRKKIRTRKSLNAIRNRSRRFNNLESKPGEVVNNERKNQFVTSNRLTLEMFPNAVRSETVTRIPNDEAKKKFNINFKDLIRDENGLKKSVSVNEEDDSNSETSIQSISDDNNLDPEINGNFACGELQSPEIVGGLQTERFTLQSTLHSTLVSAPLTVSSTDIHEKYYLYEEFMSEISVYLNQTMQKSLLSEDIIEQLKRHLFTMRLQFKDNVIPLKHKPTLSDTSDVHTSNSTEGMVIENPMEYIRFSYPTMQNTPNYQSDGNNSESVGSIIDIHSPYEVLSSSSRTSLSDTPEYIYFPHKLN